MSKKLLIGVLVVGVLATGWLIWRSTYSPEADAIDKSTQEMIKEKCRIKPDSISCKNLK